MGLVAKAFQDIITFSRATSGTYVNSNGYITNSSVLNYLTYSNQFDNAAWTKSNSFVQTNLLTYSQDIDNAAWSKTGVAVAGGSINSTIAPDGTLTAESIVEDGTTGNHWFYQTPANTAALHSLSVYLKPAGRTWAGLRMTLTGTVISYAWFNLATGTVGTVNAGLTASIQNVGNGWFRCTIYGTIVAATPVVVFAADADGSNTYAGTASLVAMYAWGVQHVQGSVPGDYRATTSAALPILYTGPSGTLNAMKLCEDATASTTHRILNNLGITVTSGAAYTWTVYAKAAERTELLLRNNNLFGATFNLASGAITGLTGGYTAEMIPIENGWYRCVVSGNAATATERLLVYTSVAGSSTYTGDGSSGIYIAQSQLNDGTSALAYYDTTASQYNSPRFDYDPVTLAAKGLLIEESRPNYMTRSSDFSNSAWNNASPNLPTVTTDAILSPDGTVNADLLTAATGGTACQARQPASTGTTGNFTASVFLKVGSATRNRIILTDHTSVFTVIGDFQVAWTAGVASVFSTTSGTASIVAAGNGWYRCIVTASTASANAVMGIAIFPDPVAGTGSVYAWNAQVEPGAFATSAIPTVASQITRAADVASVNTLSPWFNSVAGTVFVEADIMGIGATANARMLALTDGTTNNRNPLIYSGPTYAAAAQYRTGGVDQAVLTTPASTITPTVTFKIATAYATNDFVAVANGATPITDTLGTVSTVTIMGLGSDPASSEKLNGHLRRITYYPRRMTNAELQTLTTP